MYGQLLRPVAYGRQVSENWWFLRYVILECSLIITGGMRDEGKNCWRDAGWRTPPRGHLDRKKYILLLYYIVIVLCM